jgi:hypothetical protein
MKGFSPTGQLIILSFAQVHAAPRFFPVFQNRIAGATVICHGVKVCLGLESGNTVNQGNLWYCIHCKVNRPFSGSIVPANNFDKNKRVFSVMIEVNRRLYMDETTGENLLPMGNA